MKNEGGRNMRILHLLAQRPGFTGSGVYLQSIVRLADADGHQQAVLCGIPAREAVSFEVKNQPELSPVFFESAKLRFPVVGMSNVMPYKSTRYDQLKGKKLKRWMKVFTAQITKAVIEFQPDIILSHHTWLLSAIARQIAPGLPFCMINHGTALRQVKFCPEITAYILPHLCKSDLVYALNQIQKDNLVKEFQIDPEKIKITGNGYNENIFYPGLHKQGKIRKLVYAGKIAYAKGLWELLMSLIALSDSGTEFELTMCGSGSGEELDDIMFLVEKCPFPVKITGNISQNELADIFRASDIFILPSYYEGLPLVLIEALACGLQVIVNDLPGIRKWLGKAVCSSKMIDFVSLPRLDDVYSPLSEDILSYCQRLTKTIGKRLVTKSPQVDLSKEIKKFSWLEVFNRMKQYW
ncbi:MAG: glycosyltransferase family 4 protein [Candidatus Stygibacter frigidus]|nr:glycosyltransferase family 4 protein [Candidatus Stygibacter frigidus]